MRQMIRMLSLVITISIGHPDGKAQTATLYRSGVFTGTYSTIQQAINAVPYPSWAIDSIVLSPHTFYEHDLNIGHKSLIIKGESTNATKIDAEGKGRIFFSTSSPKLIIEDVIMENGFAAKTSVLSTGMGGGIYLGGGSSELILRGYSQVRNCRAERNGGGIACFRGKLQDHVKITANVADSVGGGFYADVDLHDSVEISYNRAVYGGGCYRIYNLANGNVLFLNNYASKTGGAIFFYAKDVRNARFLGNKAGKSGNALGDDSIAVIGGWHTGSIFNATNCYFYNPDSNGKRNFEINAFRFISTQCWFGNSDTTGIIKTSDARLVYDYVVADWSLNRGKTLGSADTLFPVQAGFRLNTGAPLSAGSCRWLEGHFRATGGGAFIDSISTINTTDTVQSMYRSFIAPPLNKNIDFLAWVDADTFRTTRLVWGRDTTTTKDTTTHIALEQLNQMKVLVYPIPATSELHIADAPIGSKAQLFDIAGKLVLSHSIISNDAVLPVQNLPSGQYILRITTVNGAVAVAKVSKE